MTDLDSATLVELADSLEETATSYGIQDLFIRTGSKRSSASEASTVPVKVAKVPQKPPRGVPRDPLSPVTVNPGPRNFSVHPESFSFTETPNSTAANLPSEEHGESYGEPRTDLEIAADAVGDLQVVVRRQDGSLGVPLRFSANVGFLTEDPVTGYVPGNWFYYFLNTLISIQVPATASDYQRVCVEIENAQRKLSYNYRKFMEEIDRGEVGTLLLLDGRLYPITSNITASYISRWLINFLIKIKLIYYL